MTSKNHRHLNLAVTMGWIVLFGVGIVGIIISPMPEWVLFGWVGVYMVGELYLTKLYWEK